MPLLASEHAEMPVKIDAARRHARHRVSGGDTAAIEDDDIVRDLEDQLGVPLAEQDRQPCGGWFGLIK